MAPEGTRHACQAAQTEAVNRAARVVIAVTLALWSTSLPLDLDCQTKSDLCCRLHRTSLELVRLGYRC
jgi:hypothetical protein